MRNVNWDGVSEAQEFKRPGPGGYIIKIVSVEDVEDREYLKIEYDIADGEFKNYYKDLYKSRGFWGGSFIRSYKEKALPFFKAFKTAVEASNPHFEFKNDPQSLVGKFCGVVLAEEEYEANDGSVKKRLYVAQTRSGQVIRAGDFEVPELKKLAKKNGSDSGLIGGGFTDLPADDDGELPF